LSADLISWGWRFYRSANQNHVDSSTEALRDISLLSKKLYQDLAQMSNDFEYDEKGLLMLYQSEKVGADEQNAAKVAMDLGLEVEILNRQELEAIAYGVETNAIGGVWYKSDAHLQPNNLMAFLHSKLDSMNVKVIQIPHCRAVEISKGKIDQFVTDSDVYKADEFVVAAGAWSTEIAKLADDTLQLLPGKGYSFTLPKMENSPTIPTILCEGKVAVSPFTDQIRFGGTMEITHVRDQKINRNRVQGIVNTVNDFYPQMNLEIPVGEDIWMGYRPCSPTGLPYIKRSSKCSNIIYATGHGMMGLSLGPATGYHVERIISEEVTTYNFH
jgi:D-amino-acid dehydrogenase